MVAGIVFILLLQEFRQQLIFVGTYRYGKPNGVCWKYQEGGGFLIGRVDSITGEFTAKEGMAFLYPDLQTALLGSFENGRMVAARPTRLTDLVLDPKTQIFSPVFAAGVDLSLPVLKYSMSTRTFIADQPLVPDPYEAELVEVKQSQVPGSGSGLYAKKDIPKGM